MFVPDAEDADVLACGEAPSSSAKQKEEAAARERDNRLKEAE